MTFFQESKAERQNDGKTERQKDRKTERQKDKTILFSKYFYCVLPLHCNGSFEQILIPTTAR